LFQFCLVGSDAEEFKAFTSDLAAAETYFAYSFVHQFTVEPFTYLQTEPLFWMSRYVAGRISSGQRLAGLSFPYALHCLGKQAMALEAYKAGRWAYDQLQGMRVPPSWRDEVDLNTILLRPKPFTGTAAFRTLCYLPRRGF
jgi:hypothetical protein